jgi:hypothetical protein
MLLRRMRRGEFSVFGLSATATVIGALGLAGGGMYFFRQPRELPAPPPEVRIVKEVVPGKEVVKYVERPSAKPKPDPEPNDTRGPFDGVWRMPGQPVPMFAIKQTRSGFTGTCAPNWTGTYPITYVNFRDGKLEFAVTDNKLSRYHFRMELLPSGDARMVGWMAPEDALVSLQRSVERARTPQQAYVLRVWMESEIARLGTITPIGMFRRIADPGKQTESQMRSEPNAKQPMGPSFIGK